MLCQASLHPLTADLAQVPHGAAQLKSCLAVLLRGGEQGVKILISQQRWEIGWDTNTYGTPKAQPLVQREKGGRAAGILVPLCVQEQPGPARSPHIGHERTWAWPNWDTALPARLMGAGAPLLPPC